MKKLITLATIAGLGLAAGLANAAPQAFLNNEVFIHSQAGWTQNGTIEPISLDNAHIDYIKVGAEIPNDNVSQKEDHLDFKYNSNQHETSAYEVLIKKEGKYVCNFVVSAGKGLIQKSDMVANGCSDYYIHNSVLPHIVKAPNGEDFYTASISLAKFVQ